MDLKLNLGTQLGDTLKGGKGTDTIIGRAGDDKITGSSGNDLLSGGGRPGTNTDKVAL